MTFGPSRKSVFIQPLNSRGTGEKERKVSMISHYQQSTHRFVRNIDERQFNQLCRDTKISSAEMRQFRQSGQIADQKVMVIWQTLFSQTTFLEAQLVMNKMGFKR